MFRTVLLAALVPLALGSEYSYTYEYTDAPTAAPTAETTPSPTATAVPTRMETYAPTRLTEAPSYAPTTVILHARRLVCAVAWPAAGRVCKYGAST